MLPAGRSLKASATHRHIGHTEPSGHDEDAICPEHDERVDLDLASGESIRLAGMVNLDTFDGREQKSPFVNYRAPESFS